ncbi:MAG: hypothetical protein ACKOWW_02870 [Flavobacteriales bacterium]
MKILFILPLAFVMTSCFVPRSKRVPNLIMATPIEITISEINEGLYSAESAPIRIDSISVIENILTLNYRSLVDVGRLSLVGSPLLAKSFPPIRNCKFIGSEKEIQQNDNDLKEVYQGELHFDLKPLAHKFVKDAPTYLQIEGWPEKILFIYPE